LEKHSSIINPRKEDNIMAITDIQISEELQTGAPSIKYEGKEGPRPPAQSQEEMMIAKQVWEAMGPEEQGQFSNFDEFFRSGVWKQILQQAQQDEMQEQQGIGSLGPRNMDQGPGRIPARFGGDMEELSMRETIDTPQGIETLDETETMQVAGGGLRGEKAQEIAMQIAEEQYGRDFYDLPFELQMKVYNIALDIWDSRGE
jgi:hypothetical protein